MKRKDAHHTATEDRNAKKPKRAPAENPQPSLLAKEEPSFPRGGASILTPLEHRQIKIQAANDLLFEQSGKKRAPSEDFFDAEDQENDGGDEPKAKAKARDRGNKERSAKKVRKADSRPVEEKPTRIEGLSFKVREESPICNTIR